jgi:3-oxoacyl-[acyl-carrier protein] reductase
MDVRDPQGSRGLVKTALDHFGHLDVLVANAGIGAYGGIMDLSDQQLRDMIDTNVAGAVWPIRAVVPLLVKAGGGDIVIVASVPACGQATKPCAPRSCLGGSGRRLDRELRGKGIRVSTICPGGVATEFAMGAGRTPDMPGLAEMLRAEDVAAAVVTVLKQPPTMRTLVWSMRSVFEAD